MLNEHVKRLGLGISAEGNFMMDPSVGNGTNGMGASRPATSPAPGPTAGAGNPSPTVDPANPAGGGGHTNSEIQTLLQKFPGDPAIKAKINAIAEQDFLRTDKTGSARVLDHILTLTNDSDHQEFAKMMIERVYNEGLSTQGHHGTCGAESVIRLFNRQDLGEWARVGAELVTKGSTTLRGGEILDLPFDHPQGHKDMRVSGTRSKFDALMQSAFMNAASPDGYEYSSIKSTFVVRKGENRTPAELPEGMSREASKRLIENIACTVEGGIVKRNPHIELDATVVKSGKLFDALLEMVGSEPKKPVYLTLKWPDSTDLHAVVLEGVDASGRVSFSNPHGATEGKSDGDYLDKPLRKIASNKIGLQSMTREDFEKHFSSVLVPTYCPDKREKTDFSEKAEAARRLEKDFGGAIKSSVKDMGKDLVAGHISSEHLEQRVLTSIARAMRMDKSDLGALEILLGTRAGAEEFVKSVREAFTKNATAREDLVEKLALEIVASGNVQELCTVLIKNNAPGIEGQIRQQESMRGKIKGVVDIGKVDEKIVDSFLRERTRVALRDQFENAVKDLSVKIIRPAMVAQLFHVDQSDPDWASKVKIERIMSLANEARSKDQVQQKDIPTELGRKVNSEGVFTLRRAFSAATYVSQIAGVAATWDIGGVITGPLKPIAIFGSLALSYANCYIGDSQRKSGNGYSWGQFESRANKGYPSDGELLGALAATFHAQRGAPGFAQNNPALKKHLSDLLEAMRELVDADGKIKPLKNDDRNSNLQREQLRAPMVLRVSQSNIDYAHSGVLGQIDQTAPGLSFMGNLAQLGARGLMGIFAG